jgi:hypothetical protein
MRVRQLSPTGDMTFGQSGLNFLVNSNACVAQIVKTSLQLWQGEWTFDTTQGMPWIEGVIGKHSQNSADLAIQNYILQIQGVEDITEYSSNVNGQGRTFVDSLSIQTQFSETTVQVINQTEF